MNDLNATKIFKMIIHSDKSVGKLWLLEKAMMKMCDDENVLD